MTMNDSFDNIISNMDAMVDANGRILIKCNRQNLPQIIDDDGISNFQSLSSSNDDSFNSIDYIIGKLDAYESNGKIVVVSCTTPPSTPVPAMDNNDTLVYYFI
jgi:hypothetical protein